MGAQSPVYLLCQLQNLRPAHFLGLFEVLVLHCHGMCVAALHLCSQLAVLCEKFAALSKKQT